MDNFLVKISKGSMNGEQVLATLRCLAVAGSGDCEAQSDNYDEEKVSLDIKKVAATIVIIG